MEVEVAGQSCCSSQNKHEDVVEEGGPGVDGEAAALGHLVARLLFSGRSSAAIFCSNLCQLFLIHLWVKASQAEIPLLSFIH